MSVDAIALGLMEFMGTSGESPSYTLYFFLGEKWPDPKMKPWEKKLIMIEVRIGQILYCPNIYTQYIYIHT